MNVVGIDVKAVCRPFAFEELDGRSCLARPVRSGYDAESWTTFGAHNAGADLSALIAAIAASL